MTAMLDAPTGGRLGRDDSQAAKLRNVDWSLVLLVGAIVGFGVVAILSATRNQVGYELVNKQIVFAVVGTTLMVAVGLIDYDKLRAFLPLIGIITVVVLIAVLSPLGTEVRGTKGWFNVAGFSLQPAEFAKIPLIVLLAALFTGRTGNVEAPRIVASLGILGALAALVLLEGETGSVLVYCFIALGIFTVAGIPARVLTLLMVSGVAVFSLILSSNLLKEYQVARLTSFVDPNASAADSYNQTQSVNTIGSGGLTGQGLFEGPQTQLGFVPEQETDFIFTVIAEELGFVGAAAVLLLEGLILIRIFRISQLARDGFGTLICMGVFSMLLIHIFQNVGMTLRLMPITGIPLPFVSYGGSSLITSLLCIGLVQSVSVHRRRGNLERSY